jgi:hypothetical protein
MAPLDPDIMQLQRLAGFLTFIMAASYASCKGGNRYYFLSQAISKPKLVSL